MSVRSEKAAIAPVNALAALDVTNTEGAAAPEQLGEGNSFCVANPENPLKRNVVVSIKATLNDFCLQKSRGTWAPTQEALRSICTRPLSSLHTTTSQLDVYSLTHSHHPSVPFLYDTFRFSIP